MNIKYICPFTKKTIHPRNLIQGYLLQQNREKSLTFDELKLLIYIASFPHVAPKKIFKSLYEEQKYSLPMFKKTFGMLFKVTEFLIRKYHLQKRSHSEATKEGAKKAKLTNLERYGVDQTFKVQEFNEKRKATYLAKYNVDNPFKVKDFNRSLDAIYQAKYNCSWRERKKIESKAVYERKSTEEKEQWLKKFICSKNRKTKPEIIIQNFLTNHGIGFETQFRIKPYFYDIFIKKINLLIEINGVFWHAHPDLYKPTDIIPKIGKSASEIWEKDRKKIDTAIKNGYKILTIWDRDFIRLNEQELFIFIYEKIDDIIKN